MKAVIESGVARKPARPTPATAIAVARGDGIGPEIMEATLEVLAAAGAALDLREVELGEKVYRQGLTAGIAPAAWDTLRETRVLLKGPITTPQGGGYKSLNVTIRKTLGLYANVRPCISYHPFVATKHPGMDVVVVRENEEDTYGGIEHQQTAEVAQCLKLITRPGCERICRYAFEYALANGRRKVSCLTKDNIMKLTDGLFHRVFDEVARDYPQLESEHWIVDIGTARLATQPERFDVIVTPNLYGDIISDVTAEMTGSVGMAGSANVGDQLAMFEAIHGSAPDIAGQGIANPSGLLLAAVQMLVHIGQADVASKVHNAWLRTIEAGLHTPDVYSPERSKRKLGTREFAAAVIERLGERPQTLNSVAYRQPARRQAPTRAQAEAPAVTKELVGVDVFIDRRERDPESLARLLQRANGGGLELTLITNRGVKVWPQGFPETFCVDHWRCRFRRVDGASALDHRDLLALLGRVRDQGLDFIKTEHLYLIDGKPAFSLGQGE
ncbi:MAG: NADP-dependent isocitrate dehydrogenase [Planctomycetes bacterium]|nr:NADP-dependent isocitrate dehydrogenase [Planctomycetota bacterium]